MDALGEWSGRAQLEGLLACAGCMDADEADNARMLVG
jgi:hypothetical protein